MMLMKGGGGGGLDHNFHQLAAQVRNAAKATEQQKPIVMRALGVQCLQWAVIDFRKKGRKGTDAAGGSWPDITRSAFVSRLAKRSPYQKNRESRKALTVRERELTKDIANGMPKGSSARARKARAAIAWRFYEDHPELRAIQKKRANLREKREALISKESSKYEIGLDTGRLLASLTFGVPELAKSKPSKIDGGQPTNAKLDVSATGITVGTTMEYAEHFDAKRPIFSPGFITPQRQKRLESLAASRIQFLLDQAIEGEFGGQPPPLTPTD